VHAEPQTDTSHYHSIIKILTAGDSKLLPQKLLELQRGRVPRGTPLYRKVSCVWNVGFGIF